MALFPAESAKQGARRGQSQLDAALPWGETRGARSTVTRTIGPMTRRCPRLANWASLPIPADRPAISECGCAALADASVLNVPAPERNQGSRISGRGDGWHEGSAGLAAGDQQVRAEARVETRIGAGAGMGAGHGGGGSVCAGAVAWPASSSWLYPRAECGREEPSRSDHVRRCPYAANRKRAGAVRSGWFEDRGQRSMGRGLRAEIGRLRIAETAVIGSSGVASWVARPVRPTAGQRGTGVVRRVVSCVQRVPARRVHPFSGPTSLVARPVARSPRFDFRGESRCGSSTRGCQRTSRRCGFLPGPGTGFPCGCRTPESTTGRGCVRSSQRGCRRARSSWRSRSIQLPSG